MSAWAFIIAPALAAEGMRDLTPAEQQDAAASAQEFVLSAQDAGSDLFGELAPMDDLQMSAASGGSHTAIDISSLGVNSSNSDGEVKDVSVSNANNGQIANNIVSDNGGITTVFNNTGNGVVFQSTVNVNVFLNGQGGPSPR